MAGPVDYDRITIAPDQDAQAWWDATKEKKFCIGKCNDCGHKFYPTWPSCMNCTSMNVGLMPIEGKGVIHTYNVVTQPIMAHLIETVPYIHAIIEIPEGTNADGSKTRIGGLMLDDEEHIGIGSEVELKWDDHPKQDYKIPRWQVIDKNAKVWKYPG
ncbi:MAG: OB-fold domain-containing protein [Chloroflexi bacterium]|nr:OB-fold domain-containing protein [Chloroflexota bacterium]